MVDKTPPVPQPKSGVPRGASRQSLLDPLFVANGILDLGLSLTTVHRNFSYTRPLTRFAMSLY